MKWRLLSKIFAVLLVFAIISPSLTNFNVSAATDFTDCVTDKVEYLSANEAKSYLCFIYNKSNVEEMSYEQTVMYKYMTGQYQEGTSEYVAAQYAFLVTMYRVINANSTEANAQLEASRVNLIQYLEAKAGSGIDDAGASALANEALGGIKSNIKNIVSEIFDESEYIFDAVNAYNSVVDLPAKLESFVKDIGAVLDHVKFVTGRNMAQCYNYYLAYMTYRHWVNTSPSIFSIYMDAYMLGNIADLDGIYLIMSKLGFNTWTDADVQHLIRKFAEFAYQTEESLNAYGISTDTPPSVPDESLPPSEICIIANGTWGKLSWELDNNGFLVIWGVGDMNTATTWGTNIPWRAHKDKIKNIFIGQRVTSITDYAFYDCQLLENVYIPASIKAINFFAFQECTSLKNVFISDLKAWCSIKFESYSNPLIDGKNLYVNENLITNLVLPSNIKEIKDFAFYGCNIQSVVVPESVETIGNSAFYGCKSLVKVTLPDSVTSLGAEVFKECRALANINIPKGITQLKAGVFYNCRAIVNMTIPEGVKTIGESAFNSCYSLVNITIPNTVTAINANAFSGCKAISTINIPDSVTSIGDYAFSFCGSFTSITIPDSVISIGKYFLDNSKVNTLYYLGSEQQWANISISEKNNKLKSVEIVYVYHFELAASTNEKNVVVSNNEKLILLKAGALNAQATAYLFADTDVKISHPDGTILKGAELVCTGCTIASTKIGFTESRTIVVLGDINGDGAIGTTDYAILLAKLSGSVALPRLQQKASDFDDNGFINTADLLSVRRSITA
ncbi:MAG: leucine-rich repeat protein [Clostridia bacterium]|nr:leucine-rich repeat protein [Clostridia bacterium]